MTTETVRTEIARLFGAQSATCPECSRTFDLSDNEQASEWYAGHDCEDTGGH